MRLTETAARISAHLKDFEADADINKVHPASQSRPYYYASAIRLGRFVGVQYISYQGRTNITRQEAEAYLAALDAGFVGTHWAAARAKVSRTEADT